MQISNCGTLVKGPYLFHFNSFAQSFFFSKSEDKNILVLVPLSEFTLQPPFVPIQIHDKYKKALKSSRN